jgi:hypothetical protein
MRRAAAVLIAAVALVAVAFAWRGSWGSTDVLGFDESWSAPVCTNVAASEVVFLDDAPGRTNDESAYFMVRANHTPPDANEHCTVFVNRTFNRPNVPQFPNFSARAALNDSATLTISAMSGAGCTGTARGSLTFPAHGAFRDRSTQLPAGQEVRSICIRLDDNPNTHGQRISALISVSDVRVTDAANSIAIFLERFETPT